MEQDEGNSQYRVPKASVYIVSVFNEQGIQNKFKADGQVVALLIKKLRRPRFLRGWFTTKSAEGGSLLIDLRRTIVVEILLFADLGDDEQDNRG